MRFKAYTVKMISQEEKRSKDTLTRAQVFSMVEELTSKPLCADNLVCDQCPFGCIEGLNDCALVHLSRRLEEIRKEILGEK